MKRNFKSRLSREREKIQENSETNKKATRTNGRKKAEKQRKSKWKGNLGGEVREDSLMGNYGTPWVWDRTHASRPTQRVVVRAPFFLFPPFSPSFRSYPSYGLEPISPLFGLLLPLVPRCQSENSSFCLHEALLPPVGSPLAHTRLRPSFRLVSLLDFGLPFK